MGAYLSQFGPFIPLSAPPWRPASTTSRRWIDDHGVYTNTAPVDAYRGAGRPEAIFVLERAMDYAAREMGVDPWVLREKNFIRPEQFPYNTPGGRLYDVGEFDGHMTQALERADWAGFAAAPKQRGRPWQDPRHRHGDLYRGLRLCRLGGRQARPQRGRHDHALHRHPDERSGP